MEKVGRSLAGAAVSSRTPAHAGTVLEETTADTDAAAMALPAYFVAPSASVPENAVIQPGSSVWYGTKIAEGVSVGSHSAIQDLAEVGSGSVIGSYSTLGVAAKLASGVTLGDRTVVGSGAVLESNTVVESDAVVAPGAVVTSGTTVKSKQLWQGSPATMVRELDAEELEDIVATAEHVTFLATTHNVEHAKSLEQRHLEKQELKDRTLWTRSVLEDRDGAWDTFVAVNPGAYYSEKRRGLLYDKE